MKTPICYFDIKSGVLCPRCQEKMRRGEVTELDFEILKILVKLEESGKFPELKNITYHRAYREDNIVVILISGAENAMRPPWTRIARILSGKLGLKVRLVEKTNNLRLLVEQIIAPCRLLGINVLWLPDGSEENTVRIPRSDRRRLPASPEVLQKLIRDIAGISARLIME